MSYGLNGKLPDEVNEKGELIKGSGFHLSCVTTAFNCPYCTCAHDIDDYEDKLIKSKRGYIYQLCKGCKRKLFITFGFDVVVDKADKRFPK